MGNSETPISLNCMLLDGGRIPPHHRLRSGDFLTINWNCSPPSLGPERQLWQCFQERHPNPSLSQRFTNSLSTISSRTKQIKVTGASPLTKGLMWQAFIPETTGTHGSPRVSLCLSGVLVWHGPCLSSPLITKQNTKRWWHRDCWHQRVLFTSCKPPNS